MVNKHELPITRSQHHFLMELLGPTAKHAKSRRDDEPRQVLERSKEHNVIIMESDEEEQDEDKDVEPSKPDTWSAEDDGYNSDASDDAYEQLPSTTNLDAEVGSSSPASCADYLSKSGVSRSADNVTSASEGTEYEANAPSLQLALNQETQPESRENIHILSLSDQIADARVSVQDVQRTLKSSDDRITCLEGQSEHDPKQG